MVTSTQLQSSAAKSIAAHAISGAAGGAPLHTNPPVYGQRAAMEAPAFSGGQLLLLYQRIAACGGRVPPMVVLDVCSALDCDGAESADSGVGGSLRATSAEQQPINEGAVATSGWGATANSTATSILPLFCMRKCLQRFMRNVSHAARQLNVGYVSATYEDHYWAPSSGDSSRISTPYGSNKGEGVVGFTKSQTRRPLLEQPLELLLSRIWARELQALQAERTH
ncbi:unnamed protein product [Phytomonas sp. EM1]|nr:unnamed protein product [Phytomonas sp. EM1]|eukprot:CCW65146.1 unnamed protein product [Phytomonas sp. isolate EM1]